MKVEKNYTTLLKKVWAKEWSKIPVWNSISMKPKAQDTSRKPNIEKNI